MDGKAVKAILGRNIKFLRLRKGLTQANLAEKVNISIIFLSSIERGTKFPKADTIARFANAFEVELYELFTVNELPASMIAAEHLSNDLKKNMNALIDKIFKQYLT